MKLEFDGNWRVKDATSRKGDLSIGLQYPDRLYWNRNDLSRSGAWHTYFKWLGDGKMNMYNTDDNSINQRFTQVK